MIYSRVMVKLMEIVIRINISGLRDRLEAERAKQGLSYDALAVRIGTNKTTGKLKVTGSGVWATLMGKSNATKLETLLPIADALGVDVRKEVLATFSNALENLSEEL